jgi:CDGSH-type Zn-finger protein
MNGQPKCGCGKSLHQPYCDGSHARNEQQMKEWADRVELDRYRQEAMDLWSDSCTTPRKNNDAK